MHHEISLITNISVALIAGGPEPADALVGAARRGQPGEAGAAV